MWSNTPLEPTVGDVVQMTGERACLVRGLLGKPITRDEIKMSMGCRSPSTLPRQYRGNAAVAVLSELNPEGEGTRQTHTTSL